MRTGAQKATQIGDKMTAGVTLPLVAAGGAAVKMGVDFDTSMSRIVGLVGLSTEEVDKLRGGVMDLSGETAKSPQELADALFTVTSAGFRGAEAMDVLEQAAKASAAGLGETRTIAEALTGAVNAYGPEVLDAARATDILVATARAGNFESSQLAGVLGKITPFAKQAGASLEDVGGAIALLTRVNNNATESGTQVAAMMRSFVTPTQEAKTELDALYGSTQAFRDIIAKDGLVAALQDLDGKLGGNREQLGRILGSSEASSAAFQILNADAATLAGTFGTVTDSVGMLDQAYEASSDTAGFKMKQALADLQVALIEAGEQIIPFVEALAGGISTAAQAFSQLPGPVRTGILIMAGFAAAIGPVLSIGGRLVTMLDNMKKVSSGTWAVMKGGGPIFAGIAVAIGASMLAAEKFKWEIEALDKVVGNLAGSSTKDLVAAFDALASDMPGWVSEHEKATAQLEFFRTTAEENIGTAQRLRDALAEEGKDVSALDAILGEVASSQQQVAADTDAAAGAVDEFGNAADGASGPASGLTGLLGDMVQAAKDATSETDDFAASLDELATQLAGMFDPLFAAEDATIKLAEAQQGVSAAELELLAAQDALNTAIKEHGPNSDEAAEATWNLMAATDDLEQANREAVRAAYDFEQAQLNLQSAVENGDVKLDEAIGTLDRWVAQGHITQAQADITAAKLQGIADKADEVHGRDISMGVRVNGTEATEAQLTWLARNRTSYINLAYRTTEGGKPEGVWTGGPVLPGKSYMVGEHGPELIRMSGGAGVVENAGRTQAMRDSGALSGASSSRQTVNNINVSYPPDRPSNEAISHELRLIELGNP